jgi:hypothetical protein
MPPGGWEPVKLADSTQSAVPPVGSVARYVWSLVVVAAHSPEVDVVPGAQDTATNAGVPLIAVTVQLEPLLVVVSTFPEESTATQNADDGQETAVMSFVPSAVFSAPSPPVRDSVIVGSTVLVGLPRTVAVAEASACPDPPALVAVTSTRSV